MAGKSDAVENEILDLIYGGSGFTPSANLWIALYSAAPTDAGGGTELTGNGYVRVQVANNKTTWSTASGGSLSNAIEIAFPTATGSDWTAAVAFGVHRHITNDDLVGWNTLTASKTVQVGETGRFPIGSLTVTED